MGETCAVCKKGQGPEKCEVCGFSDNGFINRQFPIPEDAKNWIETVVKPYRAQWEKIEAARHGTFTDPRDGKTYKTIKIGEQVWMAENLNYDAEGSKCYDNNEENGKKYGRLYGWETAKKACPEGWHLPSKEEWQILIDFAGGKEIAGEKLKAKNDWNDYEGKSGNGTDNFGFAALPSGEFYFEDDKFKAKSIGNYNFAWSSDPAYYWGVGYKGKKTSVVFSNNIKRNLFSIRCIQGPALIEPTYGFFTDQRDGKTYKTVKIGEQVWMGENLAYNAPNSKCYDNNEENGKKYGRLYDWETATKVPPDGWKLPTANEWKTLMDFTGDDKIAGKKLKAKSGWNKGGNGTDDFGFAALPGGECYTDGSFADGGDHGYWWSSSYNPDNDKAFGRMLLSYDDKLGDTELNKDSTYRLLIPKPSLLSVRCIQLSEDEQMIKSFLNSGETIETLSKRFDSIFGIKQPADKAAAPIPSAVFCSSCGNKLEGDVSFCPKCGTKVGSSTFTDPRDKRTYKIVKIGSQIWMAENLAFAGGGRFYEDNQEYGKKYGMLYDWNAAMKVCPKGWHLPNKEEWQILMNFVGGDKIAGEKLKAKSGWEAIVDGIPKPGNGRDLFGFTALPGGCGNSERYFSLVGSRGYWWSSSEVNNNSAYYWGMDYYRADAYNNDYEKNHLFSVRCIKD